MITAYLSQDIDRQRAKVFEYITDPAKVPLWQPSVLSVEAPAGMPAGCKIVMDTQFLGHRSKLYVDMVENDGQGFTRARSERGPLTFETTYELQEVSERRTRLTVRVKIDAGSIYKLAEPALQSISHTILETDIKLLKTILEQEQTLQPRPEGEPGS